MRPVFTFLYNYFFRLGFLDGREGLLLHLYHASVRHMEVCQGVGTATQSMWLTNQADLSS